MQAPGDKGQFKSWNKAYNFKHILFLQKLKFDPHYTKLSYFISSQNELHIKTNTKSAT